MKKDNLYTFKINKITFEKVISIFKNEYKDDNYIILRNVEPKITSLKKLEILFGIQVVHDNKKKKASLDQFICVEVSFEFLFKYDCFECDKKEREERVFKLLPNLLSIIYPYLRQKVYSCLADNHKSFSLVPFDFIRFVEKRRKKLKIVHFDDKKSKTKKINKPRKRKK